MILDILLNFFIFINMSLGIIFIYGLWSLFCDWLNDFMKRAERLDAK